MECFIKKIIFGILICFSFQSHAGVVLEPSFGIAFVGEQLTNDLKSYQPSLALGYQEAEFVCGFKFVHSIVTTQALGFDSKALRFHKNDFGVYSGHNFSTIKLRTWAALYFMSKLDTFNSHRISGTTIEVGAGILVHPLISLNLEYRHFVPEREKYGEGFPSAVASNDALNEVVFSMSAPFELKLGTN